MARHIIVGTAGHIDHGKTSLVMVLTGITYGIKPYGGSNMGWTNPFVIGMIAAGIVVLVTFVFVELRVKAPMFNLGLFRIRAFAAGNLAVVLSSVANSGMQFMLIMWLQGVWLPLHGYRFEDTPLWAGIFMLPLTVGFLTAGPIAGTLSDRHGARPFATAGMALAALSFLLLMALPANFAYWQFALVIFLNGLAFGMFAAPNTAAIMNSVPARDRGVASGMRATAQTLGMPLSIGIFFSLIVVGLTNNVPAAMYGGLTAHAVPSAVATKLAHLPPTSYLFAAFLGYNPLQQLLGHHLLSTLPLADARALIGKTLFPSLVSGPFKDGIVGVLTFSTVMCVIAALASWMRGGKYVHHEAHVAYGHAGGGPLARPAATTEDRSSQPVAERARTADLRDTRT